MVLSCSSMCACRNVSTITCRIFDIFSPNVWQVTPRSSEVDSHEGLYSVLTFFIIFFCTIIQIMKKMRDEAAKSPGNAAAAASASGAVSHSLTSPAVNTEMNNVVRRQNSASKDESRSSDTAAAAAAARHDCVSDRTSDPSMSEASVSHIYRLQVIFLNF